MKGFGQFSFHGRNHSQTIFTTGMLIKMLAASTCIVDFFRKNIAASSFYNDRKFAFSYPKISIVQQDKESTFLLTLAIDGAKRCECL